jgi:stringent starvation protein B
VASVRCLPSIHGKHESNSNATTSLVINNEAISFKARFEGKSQNIYVPTDAVLTIYTGENGEGMFFENVTDVIKVFLSVIFLFAIG